MSASMLKRVAREGVGSLWSAKQRSLLAVLGISIGISSVISMITIGKIVELETLRQFKSLGTDFIVTVVQMPSRPGLLTRELAMEAESAIPGLQAFVNYVMAADKVSVRGIKAEPSVLGVDERFANANRLRLSAGRFLHSSDGTGAFCVLGAKLADDLGLAGEGALGRSVRIGSLNFTVVGILEPLARSSLLPFDFNGSVMIPYAKARRMFPSAYPMQTVGRMSPAADPKAIPSAVTGWFNSRYPTATVQVSTAEFLIAQLEKQTRIFTLMLGAIGGISLIVGGVGVMNVMLVSVTERRTEIGLRRAIGAESRHIQLQFVIESIILCFVGGLIGVVGGLGAAISIARFSGWEFVVHAPAIVIGVGVSCLIGVFFGFYPAYQASQMKIIAAIRSS